MRKLYALAGIALMIFAASSCNDDLKKRNAELEGNVDELVATQDTLLSLVNDLTDGMNQIKQLENIISTPGSLNGESASQKEQIKNDMVAIKQALEQRRQRLDELEKKLASSGAENSKLLKTIASLKQQLATQEQELVDLRDKLASANIQIKELGETVSNLNTAVDSLNTSVATEKREREIAQEESVALSRELNTCYYAIGSKGELKKNKIIETGFLRKTKLMKGDFDQSYFTTADKRSLTSIPLNSKKAKVLTNQPAGSYTITDVNGMKVLNITNPEKFWSLSNYLVIQVD